MSDATTDYETLVIGGGQAGLAVGYHLIRRGGQFLILDANRRTGDSWRKRWDSLRLFTPSLFDGLPGMTFPGSRWDFPTKDEMADYLEEYAKRFELPIRHQTRVERLYREGERFVVEAADTRFESENVVVAMANWQQPKIPAFASELSEDIVQVHVADYKNPDQLRDGDVLVVGVGNSGAEIAMELSRSHQVYLAGPDTGHLPFRPGSLAGRILMPFVGKVILHRVLSLKTPMGRRMRARRLHHGEMLVRVKPKDLVAEGVTRTPRVTGVRDGRPLLEDGRILVVSNVVWCTGFRPGFSWIDLPVFADGEPLHRRGVVPAQPGLYFVGLKYLYAPTSSSLSGVSRDAEYVVETLMSRQSSRMREAV